MSDSDWEFVLEAHRLNCEGLYTPKPAPRDYSARLCMCRLMLPASITVSSTLENSPRPKVVYTAVLLSWGERLMVDNATHLPYMLERGELKVGTAVKSTLQHLFDCNIQQFTFTQHQLLQFGFYFVNNDPSRSTDQFTLGYKSPQVDHSETLHLSFDIADIQYIWNGVRGNFDHQNSESVNLAYRVIQNQVFSMIQLEITTFDLSEVSLPKAQIKNKGTVKMKTPEIVNCVLTVLNEISSFISKDDQ